MTWPPCCQIRQFPRGAAPHERPIFRWCDLSVGLPVGPIVNGFCMLSKSRLNRQIDVVLRVSSYSPQVWSSCLIRARPHPGSRVVEASSDSIRIAFTAPEIRLIAGAMRRTHPRFHFKLAGMRLDQNRNHVPANDGRPFLVALAADNLVKIGVEVLEYTRHPVVELTARANSRVRRTGATVTWMPRWSEIRVLAAEYAPPAASTQHRKKTGHFPAGRSRLMGIPKNPDPMES